MGFMIFGIVILWLLMPVLDVLTARLLWFGSLIIEACKVLIKSSRQTLKKNKITNSQKLFSGLCFIVFTIAFAARIFFDSNIPFRNIVFFSVVFICVMFFTYFVLTAENLCDRHSQTDSNENTRILKSLALLLFFFTTFLIYLICSKTFFIIFLIFSFLSFFIWLLIFRIILFWFVF